MTSSYFINRQGLVMVHYWIVEPLLSSASAAQLLTTVQSDGLSSPGEIIIGLVFLLNTGSDRSGFMW